MLPTLSAAYALVAALAALLLGTPGSGTTFASGLAAPTAPTLVAAYAADSVAAASRHNSAVACSAGPGVAGDDGSPDLQRLVTIATSLAAYSFMFPVRSPERAELVGHCLRLPPSTGPPLS